MRLTIALLLLTGYLTAQTSAIRNSTTEYDRKTMPSMTLTLDAPVDEVYDRWDDFWDDRYEVDIDRTDKDGNSIAYLAEQVSLANVGDKRIDLYSNVDGGEQTATVSMTLAYADDDIVTSTNHPAAFRAATSYLDEFRNYFYQRYFDEALAEIREELEDVRDDTEDASEDAQKARQKIAKYEKKIEKLREKIEDTREEVGEELETEEEKARRVRELEARLQQLQRERNNYLG